jgi:MFS family permease
MNGTSGTPSGSPGADARPDRYRWVALSNTTLSMTMATIDASIVIVAMPAIFRGIHLNPLTPGNVTYLLWMIIGYLLVQSVLVVTLGRLGDMFGRVKIYNLGFVVFTLASIALSLDPLTGTHGAMWLIGWRFGQAFGGAMLMANSAAILTDAFPANKRGMALGINQIAGISGQFVGLLLGGLLAAVDWRLVFWVNVPIGLFGTVWAYKSLREIATTKRARIDWIGNIMFAVGLGSLLVAITYGIRPYGGHATGWSSPWIITGLIGGVVVLIAFCVFETKIAEPMFNMGLFKIRAFAAGNAASLLGSIARGGLQFMLVIWLAGIWLPLHGYDFTVTPLWAGIYMLPLTAGFLIAGPISGTLSDRYGPRLFATSGLLLAAACFTGLMLLPVDFLLGVRAADLRQRGRLRPVRLPQHLRDHERRTRQVPRLRLRHAVHLPELRHVPVHRHLLLADDRRAGLDPAQDPDPRPDRPARAAVGGHAGQPPAPGQHDVRRAARLQPGAEPAGAFRRAQALARAQRGGPDREAVLPEPDLGAVPPRPDDRLHRGRDHGGGRRAGVDAARQAVLLRRQIRSRAHPAAREPQEKYSERTLPHFPAPRFPRRGGRFPGGGRFPLGGQA